ncbi:MAG TPA: hypothetical protein VLM89_17300 [Phycisphaerae bacterium]|nr:hypothetical protein [Phycisphaerae bacterium]
MTDMPTSDESRSNPPRTVRPPSTPVERRAASIQMQNRRKMVFRSTLLLALTAVALCFFVAWRRDQMTIAERLDSLSGIVQKLQAEVDQIGRLPATPPQPHGEGLGYYASDADRYYVTQTTDPVIIGATASTHLIYGEEGRVAIIYTRGRIEAKWMPVSKYDKTWAEQQERIAQFERERQARPVILP